MEPRPPADNSPKPATPIMDVARPHPDTAPAPAAPPTHGDKAPAAKAAPPTPKVPAPAPQSHTTSAAVITLAIIVCIILAGLAYYAYTKAS